MNNDTVNFIFRTEERNADPVGFAVRYIRGTVIHCLNELEMAEVDVPLLNELVNVTEGLSSENIIERSVPIRGVINRMVETWDTNDAYEQLYLYSCMSEIYYELSTINLVSEEEIHNVECLEIEEPDDMYIDEYGNWRMEEDRPDGYTTDDWR